MFAQGSNLKSVSHTFLSGSSGSELIKQRDANVSYVGFIHLLSRAVSPTSHFLFFFWGFVFLISFCNKILCFRFAALHMPNNKKHEARSDLLPLNIILFSIASYFSVIAEIYFDFNKMRD